MNISAIKEVVDSRDYERMVPFNHYPDPGDYVITGIQMGNLHGEKGWHFYVGYVVQVRLEAGAFGSHMVLIRHPDGTLMRHDNQSYYWMDGVWLQRAKDLFPGGMTYQEHEDHSKPYTLNEGNHPATGAVIQPQDWADDPAPVDESPRMTITTTHADGSKEITRC